MAYDVGRVLIVFAVFILAAGAYFTFIGNGGGILGGEDKFNILASADIQYNPADIFGQKWYVSNTAYSWSKSTSLFSVSTFSIPIIETGDITVGGSLINMGTNQVVATTTAPNFALSSITGGTKPIELNFNRVPAGNYTIIWNVYEGGVRRTTQTQSGIEVK
jgi:hypothetical protein